MHIEYLSEPLQIMSEDLQGLGYLVEWARTDAQDYLLPQRRNRIYATGDINAGQDHETYIEDMKRTMQSMASDSLLPFTSVFDITLPEEQLEGRQFEKLQESVEKACVGAKSQNVFVDMSTSTSRTSESATNVLTCIRPTHKIYSQKLQRFVTAKEMWTCQGLFPESFANPGPVHKMLSQTTRARDLAGNAFAATVMQARVLASLVHAQGWVNVSEDPTSRISRSPSDTGPVLASPTELSSDSSCKKRKPEHAPSHAAGPEPNLDSVPNAGQAPKRRCTGKTSQAASMNAPKGLLELDQMRELKHEKPRRPGRPKKNSEGADKPATSGGDPPKKRKHDDSEKPKVAREGKRPCITIWAKMRLFKEACPKAVCFYFLYIYIYICACLCIW